MSTYYQLQYHNGENLDREIFDNKDNAEKRALELSLAENEKNPDLVDEQGQIFVMDWLGYNKPYYGNESRFVQFVQVEEIEEPVL